MHHRAGEKPCFSENLMTKITASPRNLDELTDLQRHVTQLRGTESPYTGKLLHNKRTGVYHCLCCHQPLFYSDHKYDSGCGWPSFDRPVAEDAIRYLEDNSHHMQRIEIRCGHCNKLLGKGTARDLEIKCPRCGTLNHLRDMIPRSEPSDGLNGAFYADSEKEIGN